MKRRTFLQSLAAFGLAPALPTKILGAAAATPAIPTHTYMWAETLVRAHKTCNLAMLQRHLRLDLKTAQALQTRLISQGVVAAQANAYGMHQAINPLFDGMPVRSNKLFKDGVDALKDQLEKLTQADEEEATEPQAGKFVAEQEFSDASPPENDEEFSSTVAQEVTAAEEPSEGDPSALELSPLDHSSLGQKGTNSA